MTSVRKAKKQYKKGLKKCAEAVDTLYRRASAPIPQMPLYMLTKNPPTGDEREYKWYLKGNDDGK